MIILFAVGKEWCKERGIDAMGSASCVGRGDAACAGEAQRLQSADGGADCMREMRT